MGWLTDPNIWIGLLTLTLLEIVLGVDNIVFISILTGKLPQERREAARKTGLVLALIPRIFLLLFIPFVQGLTKPLFRGMPLDISGQGVVLIAGGLFLIAKSTREIHGKLEGEDEEVHVKALPTFSAVITQIMILNLVFSLDSVITAIGMVRDVGVMIASVIISTLFMIAFSGKVGDYVEKHPTIKILALSFLILIGTNLLAEGLHFPIPKGYTYFAMAFALGVEMLNLRIRHKDKPAHVRQGVTD